MKVKIKDLRPNPYRDMDNYPIDENKVDALIDSIKQTDFWDNIPVRKVNNHYEIPYGHHRWIALSRVFDLNHEIEAPVKDFPDSVMIQIMANENMDEWKPIPAIIDETVMVAKKFLEEHPEEAKKYGQTEHNPVSGNIVGRGIISRFLGWDENRVGNALRRLSLIKADILDKEASNILPTDKHAKLFADAIDSPDIDLSKERQKAFAKEIKEKEIPSREIKGFIKNTLLSEKWKQPKRTDPRKEKIIKYESYVSEIRNKADDLLQDLKKMAVAEKEIGEMAKNPYRKLLIMSLNSLCEQVQLITKKQENEKSKSSNSSIRSLTE